MSGVSWLTKRAEPNRRYMKRPSFGPQSVWNRFRAGARHAPAGSVVLDVIGNADTIVGP